MLRGTGTGRSGVDLLLRMHLLRGLRATRRYLPELCGRVGATAPPHHGRGGHSDALAGPGRQEYHAKAVTITRYVATADQRPLVRRTSTGWSKQVLIVAEVRASSTVPAATVLPSRSNRA